MSTYAQNMSMIIDAVTARLIDNLDLIKNPVVEVRTGDVQFPADSNTQLPIIYVYPMVNGNLISLTIDDEASLSEFNIALDCFYWFEENDNTSTSVSLSIDNMMNIAELFKAKGGHLLPEAYVTDIECEYTKYAVGGSVIDSYAIELSVTTYN